MNQVMHNEDLEVEIDKIFYFLKPEDRVMMFIDGPNTYYAARACSFELDYKRLYEILTERCRLIRAMYFTTMMEDQNSYTAIRPLVDWLSYNEYVVETKSTKSYPANGGGTKIKGSLDVEIAVAVMTAIHTNPGIDTVILFTGDGDFMRLVEAVQRQNVKIVIVSTRSSDPPMVADELRKQTDHFLDLVKLSKYLNRDQRPIPRRESYARTLSGGED